MDARALTAPQRRHFTALLDKRRADAAVHLDRLRETMGDVQVARADASADDEHDPEGATMSQEWSSLVGLVATAEKDLAIIDKAIERMHSGTFGVCSRCGNPIGKARLDARPATELCIDCARLAG